MAEARGLFRYPPAGSLASTLVRAPAYKAWPPRARARFARRPLRLRPAHACSASFALSSSGPRAAQVPWAGLAKRSLCKAWLCCGVTWLKESRSLLAVSATMGSTHRLSLCKPYVGIRHYTHILDWNCICSSLSNQELNKKPEVCGGGGWGGEGGGEIASES